jgi:hypothetical protein
MFPQQCSSDEFSSPVYDEMSNYTKRPSSRKTKKSTKAKKYSKKEIGRVFRTIIPLNRTRIALTKRSTRSRGVFRICHCRAKLRFLPGPHWLLVPVSSSITTLKEHMETRLGCAAYPPGKPGCKSANRSATICNIAQYYLT